MKYLVLMVLLCSFSGILLLGKVVNAVSFNGIIESDKVIKQGDSLIVIGNVQDSYKVINRETITPTSTPTTIMPISIPILITQANQYLDRKVSVSGNYLGYRGGFGTPPISRSDWLLQDSTAVIYVHGSSLGLVYPRDVGKQIKIVGIISRRGNQF